MEKNHVSDSTISSYFTPYTGQYMFN